MYYSLSATTYQKCLLFADTFLADVLYAIATDVLTAGLDISAATPSRMSRRHACAESDAQGVLPSACSMLRLLAPNHIIICEALLQGGS